MIRKKGLANAMILTPKLVIEKQAVIFFIQNYTSVFIYFTLINKNSVSRLSKMKNVLILKFCFNAAGIIHEQLTKTSVLLNY